MNETRGCERVLARLDEYVDDGLPPIEAARDAGHLEVCAACEVELERRRADREALRFVLAPHAAEAEDALRAATASLETRFARGTGGLTARRRLRILRNRPLVAALTAAAALLLLAGLELAGLGPDLSSLDAPRFPDWDISLPIGDMLPGLGGVR